VITAVDTKKAVGYFRVSSNAQAGEHHSSLSTQESRFQQYCQGNDIQPVATFTDTVTGRRDDRQEYQRMIDYVLKDGADMVVVQFLDRFGRNPREILRRYWQFEENGIKVIATDEDLREELQLLIKAYIAGHESKRNSERVRSNMMRATEKGVHAGRAPFGLKAVKQIEGDKVAVSWEIDPTEAPLVRIMYDLAIVENLGYKGIADRLTSMGYLGREGRPFASFTIQRILTNPAITGILAYGRRPKKGNPQPQIIEKKDVFPAILTSEEWQLLQERLAIRRENPKGKGHTSAYLLSGMARCGHCRGPMTGKAGSLRKGKRYRNYYCNRAMKSRALCDTYNGHSAPKLEKVILEYLGQYSDPERVRELLSATEQRELERCEAELNGIEKRLAELDNQFRKDMDRLDRGILNEADFAKRNADRHNEQPILEARKAILQSKVESERSKADMINRVPLAINSFFEDLQKLDIRQQKARLQTILKTAYVYRDGRIELEFRN